jgi:serine/threonine-protein kinase HipA
MKYPSVATVEIHQHGRWVAAAELCALADNRVQFSYLDDYIFSGSAVPVALGLPVGHFPESMTEGPLGLEPDRRPPAFLYDLVPQGRGRKFLLSMLALPDHDEMVMPLVMAGAFNPIGCLRLDSAVRFYQEQAIRNPDASASDGFALSDILHKSEAFLEHMALHAMLASGTTGVQGVAPKFLLTTDKNGRWFADMAMADEDASEHWLVKLPRGRSEDDRCVLRNEGAYLQVARAAGLRVHHAPMQHGDMLFVRRFDRAVGAQGLQRLHQESVASLIGQRGFGVVHRQQDLLTAIRAVASHPLAETIEFIKRDVLNLALRNTDNHARNTAVQRTPEGRIQLTPVFDFAPMFKDPEVVPRSCHWRDEAGKRQSGWRETLEQLQVPDQERQDIAAELGAFANVVERLEAMALDCGVEREVVQACLKSIEEQAYQLRALQQGLGAHG